MYHHCVDISIPWCSRHQNEQYCLFSRVAVMQWRCRVHIWVLLVPLLQGFFLTLSTLMKTMNGMFHRSI